jgi:hypothetical protein
MGLRGRLMCVGCVPMGLFKKEKKERKKQSSYIYSDLIREIRM